MKGISQSYNKISLIMIKRAGKQQYFGATTEALFYRFRLSTEKKPEERRQNS